MTPRSARRRLNQPDGVVGRAHDRAGSGRPRSRISASISRSIADSPCSGAAEWPARPRACSLTRNTPRVAVRQPAVGGLAVDQVTRRRGQPVRHRRAIAAALLADHEQQADAPLAAGRKRSAAASCAARIPLASQAPRPCNRHVTRTGKNGGTQSSASRAPPPAHRPWQPDSRSRAASGCSVTR